MLFKFVTIIQKEGMKGGQEGEMEEKGRNKGRKDHFCSGKRYNFQIQQLIKNSDDKIET